MLRKCNTNSFKQLSACHVRTTVARYKSYGKQPHSLPPSTPCLRHRSVACISRSEGAEVQPELEISGRASDGLEAVQQAKELQPDLILLDIGLPTINGIEAARRIREISPASKILFVSENRSRDVAEEALRTGASGYVVKSDVASELLTAVRAVLDGKRFVSASLAGYFLAAMVATARQTDLLTSMVALISGIC